MEKSLLRGIIKSNCYKNDICMGDLAKVIGKSESQLRKLIREETLKYEDLRAISKFLNLSNEEKAQLL